jgi:hypothetical protein
MDHHTFFSGMYYSLAHLPRRMFAGPNNLTIEMRVCQIFLSLSSREREGERGSMEATRQL